MNEKYRLPVVALTQADRPQPGCFSLSESERGDGRRALKSQQVEGRHGRLRLTPIGSFHNLPAVERPRLHRRASERRPARVGERVDFP